jgi:hypothetical protein
MKNQASKSFAVFLLLALVWAVPLAYAQTPSRLKAHIPFNFLVGSRPLPAGDYFVKPMTQEAILVQSVDNRSSAVVLTTAVQAKTTPEVGKLVFNQYGDQYFLSQIWTSEASTGRELFKSRMEREIASKISNPEKKTLIAEKK